MLATLSPGGLHDCALSKALRRASGEATQVEEGGSCPALHRVERRGRVEAQVRRELDAHQALAAAELEAAGCAPVALEAVVVAVGDVLELVDLDSDQELDDVQVMIERDGRALLPELGWRPVAGLSRPELERQLDEAYAPLFERGPRLCVRIHTR